MAAQSIPKTEAQELCDLSKIGSPTAKWSTSGVMIWKSSFGLVCNPRRRGLIVELYASQGGRKVPNRKINVGLIDTIDGDWVRVYQLTIVGANHPSHTEKGEIWYGAHEHMGLEADKLPILNDAPFTVAIDFFCTRTNLQLESPITDPFSFAL
jgi:hypothetical protein